MKHSIIISFLLLSFGSCNNLSREGKQSESYKEYDLINRNEIGLLSTKVDIIYKDTVEGFLVNAVWYPYGKGAEIGQAIMEFQHIIEGTHFFIYNSYFSDNYFYNEIRNSLSFENNEVFFQDYVYPKKDENFGHNSPFLFKDVDFDGEKELLINNWRSGHRNNNTYDVYKVSKYHAEKLTAKPFDCLEDSNVMDFDKKTITQFCSSGWNNFTKRVYGLHEIESLLNSGIEKVFKLDSLTVCENGIMQEFVRKGDRMTLKKTYNTE